MKGIVARLDAIRKPFSERVEDLKLRAATYTTYSEAEILIGKAKMLDPSSYVEIDRIVKERYYNELCNKENFWQ